MNGTLLAAVTQKDIIALFPPAKNFGTIGAIINVILPVVSVGAGLIFVGMMIYAGFLYMGSEGSPETIKKIQKLLTWSIIGFVIVVASFIFVRFLFFLFNLTAPV